MAAAAAAAVASPPLAAFQKPSAVGKICYFKKGAKMGAGPGGATGDQGIGSGDQTVTQGKVKGTNFKGRDQLAPEQMQVYDARPSLTEWKIDTHGFRVAPFKTSLAFTMENLFDDKEVDVRNVYVPEVEEMMKQNAVLADGRLPKYVFGLRIQRFSEERDRGYLASYSRQAHCDFSDILFDSSAKIMANAARKRGVQICSERELDEQMDMVMYNTWQPVMRPAYNDPLTLLDWSSVDVGDFREVKRGGQMKRAPDGKPS